jgi:hypothetical protein
MNECMVKKSGCCGPEEQMFPEGLPHKSTGMRALYPSLFGSGKTALPSFEARRGQQVSQVHSEDSGGNRSR